MVRVGKIGSTGAVAADVKILVVEGAIVAAQAMEEEVQHGLVEAWGLAASFSSTSS
jgi:hypothetical protein